MHVPWRKERHSLLLRCCIAEISVAALTWPFSSRERLIRRHATLHLVVACHFTWRRCHRSSWEMTAENKLSARCQSRATMLFRIFAVPYTWLHGSRILPCICSRRRRSVLWRTSIGVMVLRVPIWAEAVGPGFVTDDSDHNVIKAHVHTYNFWSNSCIECS